MSEDYLAQAQPTQTWNTVRGVWEKQGIANLLCEHWELFSETWQTSGTMRNGKVYALPTPERHTTDSESLLLRSPTASQGEGGALGEAEARKRGNTIGIRDNAMDIARLNGLKVSRAVDNLMPTPKARDSQAEGYEAGLRRATPQVGTIVKGLVEGDPRVLMPTPNTMDHLPARTPEQKALNKGKGGYANVRETVVNDLIPTPTTRDYKDGTAEHERDGVIQTDTVARAIFNSGEVLLPTTRAQNGEDRNNKIWARDPSKPQNLENALAVTLLPTTRTSMANGPTQKEIALGNPKTRIETEVMLGETSWGKFEPAIRRWEKTLGRPSPLPTKPDGKDGAHRLSSAFTEWMMGLPEGWVTGVGLTRNEELKACGNGVVPQQAEMALRSLLQGFGEL